MIKIAYCVQTVVPEFVCAKKKERERHCEEVPHICDTYHHQPFDLEILHLQPDHSYPPMSWWPGEPVDADAKIEELHSPRMTKSTIATHKLLQPCCRWQGGRHAPFAVLDALQTSWPLGMQQWARARRCRAWAPPQSMSPQLSPREPLYETTRQQPIRVLKHLMLKSRKRAIQEGSWVSWSSRWPWCDPWSTSKGPAQLPINRQSNSTPAPTCWHA